MSAPKIDPDELVEKYPALTYELTGSHKAWELAQRRYNTGEDFLTNDKAMLELALLAAETHREAREAAFRETLVSLHNAAQTVSSPMLLLGAHKVWLEEHIRTLEACDGEFDAAEREDDEQRQRFRTQRD